MFPLAKPWQVVCLFIELFFGFLFLCVSAEAQSQATGLGRLYIEPLGSELVPLITAEIVQQRIPLITAHSEQDSDCILFWTPLQDPAANVPLKTARAPATDKTLIEGDMAIFDRQQKTIVWDFSLKTKRFEELSLHEQKDLAAKIVHRMGQKGAYCGGAPFNAPAQNAADRTKAFKPPFFNW